MNEVMVEVGEAKERLNILDFSSYRPILNDLDFSRGLVRPSRDSIYLRYSQEVVWNSHLSAQAKSPLAQSLEYFPNMGFVLGNVVGIDEDVIQIYDDMMSIISMKMLFMNL